MGGPRAWALVVIMGVLSALGVVGCDVGPGVGCDFRDGSANGPEPRCQQRDGADAAAFAGSCEALGGEVIDGGCDTTGSVGGCEISGDNPLTTVIDFYYPPLTAADAQAECAEDGGEWAPL